MTLQLMSNDVKHITEYFVYDFGRLLGNVGGSLGMFVGLSFYHVFEHAFDFAYAGVRRVLKFL